MAESSALVLFSGGQDSTICLAHALARYDRVETVGFDYGQRHAVELACRPKILAALKSAFPDWGKKLGQDHLCDMSILGEISDTAMTRDTEIEIADSGLPNTFVPGRNLLFLTLAGAIAWRRGISTLVGGMLSFCAKLQHQKSARMVSCKWSSYISLTTLRLTTF